jgi:hypothetical protein
VLEGFINASKSMTDAFVRTVKLPNKTDKPNQVVYLDRMERGLSLALVVSYGGSRTFRAATCDDAGNYERCQPD